jgi:serine/threonine protein kinase/tetratricopeptide (TPR) repeat protein
MANPIKIVNQDNSHSDEHHTMPTTNLARKTTRSHEDESSNDAGPKEQGQHQRNHHSRPQVGSVLFNRYHLDRIAGNGAYGSVWVAQDTVENKTICLKILHKLTRSAVENLTFEFLALSGLSHPHLEEVYDFYPPTGSQTSFFTCEYIEGSDLLAASRELLLLERMNLFASLTQALEFLHQNRLMHLDIKPQNILIGQEGLKLIDFGLAMPTNQNQQKVSGTPGYMAPEIIRQEPVDQRADLYSLGVILYKLITGRAPFTGQKIDVLLDATLHDRPPPLGLSPGSIPAVLERVVFRLLAKSPVDRYDSASEVLQELRRANIRIVESGAMRSARTRSNALIGRDAECALIKDMVSGLNEGTWTPFLLIEGEPGLGKSRLQKELRIYSQTKGLACFLGAAHTDSPGHLAAFGSVLWKLWTRVTSTISKEKRQQLDWENRFGQVLGTVIPDLADRTWVHSTAQLVNGIAEWILEATDLLPSIIIIEDLHWADATSISLVEALAKASTVSEKPTRLLITISYRGEEIDSDLAGTVLMKIKNAQTANFIRLQPLNIEECTRLIAAMIGAEFSERTFAERLHRLSEGVPLFLEQTLNGLLEESGDQTIGRFDSKALANAPVPDTISELLLRRIESRSEPEQEIIRILAVWNRPCQLATIAQLVDLSQQDTSRILHTLRIRQIVDRFIEDDMEVFALVHAHLRTTVYDHINQTERCTYHGRIANILQERKSDRSIWPQISMHLAKAQRAQEALEFGLVAVADLDAAYSIDQALALCELLLEATVGHTEARVQVLLTLVRLYDNLHLPERYRATCREALDLIPDNSDSKTKLFVQMAQFERTRGDPTRLSQLIQEIEPLGERWAADSPTVFAGYWVCRAVTHWFAGENHQAIAIYEQAYRIWQQTDMKSSRYLWALLGGKIIVSTESLVALNDPTIDSELDQAKELVSRSEDTDLYGMTRIGVIEVNLHWRRGNLAEARKVSQTVEEALGNSALVPRNAALFHITNGHLEAWQGNRELAMQKYTQAGKIAARGADRRAEALCIAGLVPLWLDEGRLSDALRISGRCLETLRNKSFIDLIPRISYVHACALLECGQKEKAFEVLNAAISISKDTREGWGGRFAEALRCRIMAQDGDLSGALEALSELENRCIDNHDQVATWNVRLERANSYLACEHWKQAIESGTKLYHAALAEGATRIAHGALVTVVQAAAEDSSNPGQEVEDAALEEFRSCVATGQRWAGWKLGSALSHSCARHHRLSHSQHLWRTSINLLEQMRPDVDVAVLKDVIATKAHRMAKRLLFLSLSESAQAVLENREPLELAHLAGTLDHISEVHKMETINPLASSQNRAQKQAAMQILKRALSSSCGIGGVVVFSRSGSLQDSRLAYFLGVQNPELFLTRSAVHTVLVQTIAARLPKKTSNLHKRHAEPVIVVHGKPNIIGVPLFTKLGALDSQFWEPREGQYARAVGVVLIELAPATTLTEKQKEDLQALSAQSALVLEHQG